MPVPPKKRGQQYRPVLESGQVYRCRLRVMTEMPKGKFDKYLGANNMLSLTSGLFRMRTPRCPTYLWFPYQSATNIVNILRIGRRTWSSFTTCVTILTLVLNLVLNSVQVYRCSRAVSEILIHERRVPLDTSRGTSTKFRIDATYVLYKYYDVREKPYSSTVADLQLAL